MLTMKKTAVAGLIAIAGLGLGMGVGNAGVKHIDGGTWRYGTDNGQYPTYNFSEYSHGSRVHSSAVRNCNGTQRSGWYDGGTLAVSYQNRCLTGNEAFYDVKNGGSGSISSDNER
ncbi:lactococcin 972 family bacteriocin [Nocardia arthritidis]|uniref:lactococcin 972 family bacteriocin n=1 Tax=Nocardia arthritidis TaxID=228602 RepID=UPI000A023D60|nr:lactococcin 972 family bacteriocin [Nocardia arthritidis]